ncbi:MAG: cellulase family glycosylhydrolase [Gammaproteobacteria bacterium]
MAITNVLKKRLMKGESTQCGISRWAALGFILSMTACTSPTAADIRLSGVNGALWGGVDPARAVDAMKDAGFNSMRLEFAWSLVEKKKGVFAWPPALAMPRKAVSLQQASGMKPLVALDYGNPALYPGTGKSQAFIDGFTRYAKWLATELKGSVRHFEVWNEWNGGIGLPCTYQNPQGICTGEAYVKLLCPVYAALKQVDPSIVVVGGATAGIDNRFIDDLIKNGGAKCLDVLSLHMYRYNKSSEPAEVTLSKLQSLQNRIKPIVGKEIPFYITETGVTVYRGGKHTLDKQADYLARFYLAAKAYPFIQGIWEYGLTDLNARNLFQGSFGLMYRDFTPKPAYSAMQDVTGLFAESEFLGKVKSISDIWLLKFREPNGPYTYTVWSTGAATSTNLILNAPVAGALNIQEVGSDPIAVTKASFEAGSNAIKVAVSSTPRIIWVPGANIDITEAAK